MPMHSNAKQLVWVGVIFVVVCLFWAAMSSRKTESSYSKTNQRELTIDDLPIASGNNEFRYRIDSQNPALSFLPSFKNTNSDSNNYISNENVLPTTEEMEKLSHDKLTHIYHRYTQNIQIFCHNIRRFGIIKGAYYLCEDEKIRPRENCLVFSFGIDFDFSFDIEIVNRYNCVVHAFDPRMTKVGHEPSKNVFFSAHGLWSHYKKTSKMELKPFSMIRKELGYKEDRIIDIMKIDIEEAEWTAVPEMIKSGVFKNVRQFMFECHISDLVHHPAGYQRNTKERYLVALNILRYLYDIGFRSYYFFNPLMETKHFTYPYKGETREEGIVTIISMVNTNLMYS